MTPLRFLALTAALAALAGCTAAGDGDPAAPPQSTESAYAVPTVGPLKAPPSQPTDDITPTTVIVGTVTRGDTGPCYGLITDDGVQYALLSSKNYVLTTGMRIKVDAAPSMHDIACGAGTLVEVKSLMALR